MGLSKSKESSEFIASNIELPQSMTNDESKDSPNLDVKKGLDKVTSNASSMEEDVASSQSVRGRPKSGRIWKTSKERFATIKKTIRGKKKKERLAYRDEIKQIKELSQSIKAEKKRENEEKRLRREENKQRRLENERKSEIVQIINNPAKLKRMRRKQLRMIEKRDISKLKVV